MADSQQIVRKVWSTCNLLRDDSFHTATIDEYPVESRAIEEVLAWIPKPGADAFGLGRRRPHGGLALVKGHDQRARALGPDPMLDFAVISPRCPRTTPAEPPETGQPL